MKGPKLVFFDLDGTLFDSEDAVWKSLQRQAATVPELRFIKTREDMRKLYLTNFYDAVCKYAGVPAEKAIEIRKKMSESFPEDYNPPLHRGIKDALVALKNRKIVLMTSNFGKPVNSLLERNGISGFFDFVSTADEGYSKKERIKKLLAKFDSLPNEAVFVTDTVGDIKEAEAEEIPSIAVSWGFHSSQLLLENRAIAACRTAADIPRIIGKMSNETSCGCIIFHEDKTLIVKQRNNFWTFPRGRVEPGENEEQCAIRETMEETGLSKQEFKIIPGFRFAHWNSTRDLKTSSAHFSKKLVFFVAKATNERALGLRKGEITGIRWVEFDEVHKLMDLPWHKEAFSKAVDFVRKNG